MDDNEDTTPEQECVDVAAARRDETITVNIVNIVDHRDCRRVICSCGRLFSVCGERCRMYPPMEYK